MLDASASAYTYYYVRAQLLGKDSGIVRLEKSKGSCSVEDLKVSAATQRED